jgi:ABC-2 type transport system ATP-binding protein
MNGLDPAGIVEIRELILKLNQERNITFLISSHILTELALVATKYGIISKGKILKEISAEDLKKECRKVTTIETKDKDALSQLLMKEFDAENLALAPNGMKIYGQVNLNDLSGKLIAAGTEISAINSSETNIEDYYLSLIGGSHV